MEKKETYEAPNSLKGHFIMAMPGLADPNFSNTVTCICEHSALGSVGLIINRIHPGSTGKGIFGELGLESLPGSESIPIHIGGPVHVNEIFILHGPPFHWEGCFRVNETLAMSNTIDIIKSISMNQGPKSYLLCLGCAGWAPGQLEFEIKQNSWITATADDGIIFNVPVELKWKEALKQVGVDPALLSIKPGHA
jgi:putative transcriptional regulator